MEKLKALRPPALERLRAARDLDDLGLIESGPDKLALCEIASASTTQEHAILAELARILGGKRAASKMLKDWRTDHKRHQAEVNRASGASEDVAEWSIGRGCVAPPGYTYDASGIWTDSGEQVAIAPIGITGRFVESSSGQAGIERVEVSWVADGRTSYRAVDASVIRTKRKAVERLGLYGAPVNDETAGDVVRYLCAQSSLTPITSEFRRRCGWQVDGLEFALPGRHDDFLAVYEDELDSNIAAAYTQKGTMEGSLKACQNLHPTSLAVLYAAVSSPLLGVLGIQTGGTVSIAATSGTGKSKLLQLAASCWGTPQTGKMVLNFDATTAGLERQMVFQTDTGLFVDETQQARSSEALDRFAYNLANSAGATRMTTKTESFRLVAIVTGETSYLDLTTQKGAQNRVLELSQQPNTSGFYLSADHCTEAIDAFIANHGHIGPAVVRWLKQRSTQEVRSMFRLRRELYKHLKLDDRMIDLLAVIRVAGDVLHELGLPKVDLDPVAVLGESSETLRRENDADLQALDVLRNYLAGWRTRENLEPTSTKQRIAAQSPSPEDAAGHLSHKLGLTKNQAQAAIKRLTEDGYLYQGRLNVAKIRGDEMLKAERVKITFVCLAETWEQGGDDQ